MTLICPATGMRCQNSGCGPSSRRSESTSGDLLAIEFPNCLIQRNTSYGIAIGGPAMDTLPYTQMPMRLMALTKEERQELADELYRRLTQSEQSRSDTSLYLTITEFFGV